MMYRIILILFLLITIPSYGETIRTFNPYPYNMQRRMYNPQHYRQNYNTIPNLSRKNLTALERYALKKNYSRENDIKRLERLEELTFGSIQNGDLYNRYKNVENAILSRPQNNYRQPLLNKIGNYFFGQTTGLTPNIIQNFPEYTYNNSGHLQNRINQYSNGFFNNGFSYFGNDYGSQTGVRILD